MNLLENLSTKGYILESPKISLPKNYGGLGVRYFNNLSTKLDKILQVDSTSGLTETNGSVRGRSIMIALKLTEMQIGKNDIILIMSRCHSEQTIVVLASLLIGAIVAPIDPDVSQFKCKEIIAKLKPKICFCDIRSVSQIESALNELNLNSKIVNFGQSHNSSVQFLKLFTFNEDDDFQPTFVPDPQKSTAFIVATQGTTDFPKLVSLSHNNILLQTFLFLNIIETPEKVLSYCPLSWILEIIVMCASFEAFIIRIIPSSFQERTACKLIQDLQIDFLLLGTNLTLQLIENVAIKDYNIKCLKFIMVGTTVTSKIRMQRFRNLLPQIKFIQIYFSTETGLIAANSHDKYMESCHKPEAIGPLLSSSKVKIIDIESGKLLGPNKYGQLLFNGDGLMLGYFGDKELTIKSMDNGYFKTGDIAEFDKDGWLYVYGRTEDLIHIEKNIFRPNELEDVILLHPLVKNVAAISNGKELIACVVKKPFTNLAPQALLSFLNNRLPEHLQPTRVIIMDNLPITSTGEVKKRKLREKFFGFKIEHRNSLSSVNFNF